MTAETKALDPCALASLTCGILLCEAGFGVVHEAATWLLGHEVWTHEFIDPEIKAALIEAVRGQYPGLVLDAAKDWLALVDQIHAEYGETVLVVRGDHQRGRGPIETLVGLRR